MPMSTGKIQETARSVFNRLDFITWDVLSSWVPTNGSCLTQKKLHAGRAKSCAPKQFRRQGQGWHHHPPTAEPVNLALAAMGTTSAPPVQPVGRHTLAASDV